MAITTIGHGATPHMVTVNWFKWNHHQVGEDQHHHHLLCLAVWYHQGYKIWLTNKSWQFPMVYQWIGKKIFNDKKHVFWVKFPLNQSIKFIMISHDMVDVSPWKWLPGFWGFRWKPVRNTERRSHGARREPHARGIVGIHPKVVPAHLQAVTKCQEDWKIMGWCLMMV